MSIIEQELYLPATDSELHSYVSKLRRVANNFTIGDGWHTSLSINREVTLDDNSVRAVKFELDVEDETTVFEVGMSERTPINGLWDQTVVANLLKGDYLGLNTSEYLDELKEEYNVEDEGFIEGYLEREKRLKVYKGNRSVAAMQAFNMNIMDESFVYLDSEIGYCPGAFDGEEANDLELERLIKFGELLLDGASMEKKQSEVTRADLLIAFNSLKGAGIVRQSMTAYRGAPLDFKGVDFFSIHGE